MAAGAAVAAYFGAQGATAAVVAGAVNGAIIGAAVGAVGAAVSGGNILQGMAKGALTGAATGAVAGGVSYAFNGAGGGSIPEGTDVSQVGTGTEAGGQALAAPATDGGLAATSEGGVIQPPSSLAGPEVVPTQPGAPGAVPTPTTPTPPQAGGAGMTDNQYKLLIKEMGAESFKREAVSGAVQAGMGAYASREEAKTQAESDQAALDAAKPAGVLRRDYAGATVSPEYSANRPQVVAPIVERPTAVQVGVERPTADIRNISVQKGVLPNG